MRKPRKTLSTYAALRGSSNNVSSVSGPRRPIFLKEYRALWTNEQKQKKSVADGKLQARNFIYGEIESEDLMHPKE